MDENVKEKLSREIDTWCQSHGFKTNKEWTELLIAQIDGTVKIGKAKATKKLKMTPEETEVFNGACRAIEQYTLKMDANTRANVALLLSEVAAKIGIRFSDMAMEKYNLTAVLNLSKSKDAQERDVKRAERRKKVAEKKKAAKAKK